MHPTPQLRIIQNVCRVTLKRLREIAVCILSSLLMHAGTRRTQLARADDEPGGRKTPSENVHHSSKEKSKNRVDVAAEKKKGGKKALTKQVVLKQTGKEETTLAVPVHYSCDS